MPTTQSSCAVIWTSLFLVPSDPLQSYKRPSSTSYSPFLILSSYLIHLHSHLHISTSWDSGPATTLKLSLRTTTTPSTTTTDQTIIRYLLVDDRHRLYDSRFYFLQAKLSHEVIGGAAAFEAAKAWEDHQEKGKYHCPTTSASPAHDLVAFLFRGQASIPC